MKDCPETDGDRILLHLMRAGVPLNEKPSCKGRRRKRHAPPPDPNRPSMKGRPVKDGDIVRHHGGEKGRCPQ